VPANPGFNVRRRANQGHLSTRNFSEKLLRAKFLQVHRHAGRAIDHHSLNPIRTIAKDLFALALAQTFSPDLLGDIRLDHLVEVLNHMFL
jgi:hypothetical protein